MIPSTWWLTILKFFWTIDRDTRFLWTVWGVTFLIAVPRLFLTTHPLSLAGSYQAIAHIWVGMLLVWGWNLRLVRWALFALIGLELVMTLLR